MSDKHGTRDLNRGKADFNAPRMLARSLTANYSLKAKQDQHNKPLWRKWFRAPLKWWKVRRDARLALQKDGADDFSALSVPFRDVMYQDANGEIFIGRGYPLLNERDVLRVMHGCLGRGQHASKFAARECWRAMRSGTTPVAHIAIDMDDFDQYLVGRHLPALQKKIKEWFRPAAKPYARYANPAITVYEDLPDAIKVVILYLAYRLPLTLTNRNSLRSLTRTLDWHYFARVLQQPVRTSDQAVRDATLRIKEMLTPRAYARVRKVLNRQSIVGHRALAQEYQQVTGRKVQDEPSDCIQDRMLEHVDANSDGLSAICLSGGGIRSASFCLGALQVLASHGLFGRFHYISTVSGGGYIGTALTRWMTAKVRDDYLDPRQALEFAQAELERLRSADYVQHRMTGIAFDQEGPLTWLRMNSNYLARRLSLFSADAWTVVATYLRNLAIVWVIFFPWVAIYLFLPWFAIWCAQYRLLSSGVPLKLITALKPLLDAVRPGLASPSSVAVALGVTGAFVGIFGASYFYQGRPNSDGNPYGNGIRFPAREGDTRAAFGALMLVLASFALSISMWSELDQPSLEEFQLRQTVLRYCYVPAAIFGTQFWLAFLNINPKTTWSARIMFGAALLASTIQVGLILWIRWGLQRWPPDASQSNMLTLGTTARALVTPPLMIVALLLGEGVKAAVRSFTEPPARREHQARAHAFSFMLLTAWIAGAVLVIAVPALLTYYGESAPAITAAGSAVSVAVSAWFGYRKSSPGKPEAKTPISLSLIGSAGVALLAILVSIGAWKAFEHLTTPRDWQRPVRCQCPAPNTEEHAPLRQSRYVEKGFQVPAEESICSIPASQCVDRPFTLYFDDLVANFCTDTLRDALGLMLLISVACLALGFIIRMNEFSLHGFYRDRLIRAFYGGFRGYRKPRKAALFTGFDQSDDIPLHVVRTLYPDSYKFDENGRPNKPAFLVVNTALNLVKGTELAWQERKADSFTLTALNGGNYRLGYRPVRHFANGVMLGTAMAISGAAFNPNMGYNSSAPMAFLMSVLNVRLGWWLGNPRSVKWRKKDPSSSSWRLLQEAAGQTTDTDDWIHLSDGGHFDNLGLWEMVHRRCRRILVIDASQDGRFALEDLYTAIRKIRIDMGIEISADKDPVLLFPRSARAAGLCHARFTIRYPEADGGERCDRHNGILLYLKPCVYGTEPPDIQEYAHKHPDFPHESTADQFFNESQFESYRKLGEWEMEKLLRYAVGKSDWEDLPPEIPIDKRGDAAGLFSKPETGIA
jgi:hypothetical protein